MKSVSALTPSSGTALANRRARSADHTGDLSVHEGQQQKTLQGTICQVHLSANWNGTSIRERLAFATSLQKSLLSSPYMFCWLIDFIHFSHNSPFAFSHLQRPDRYSGKCRRRVKHGAVIARDGTTVIDGHAISALPSKSSRTTTIVRPAGPIFFCAPAQLHHNG